MKLSLAELKAIVRKVPTELRHAARKERAVIQKQMAKDPLGTSFSLAHGQYNFENNLKLQEEVSKILKTRAAEAYAEANAFIQRQPLGERLNAVASPYEFAQKQSEMFL